VASSALLDSGVLYSSLMFLWLAALILGVKLISDFERFGVTLIGSNSPVKLSSLVTSVSPSSLSSSSCTPVLKITFAPNVILHVS
jgi:hypothetical protein